MRKSHKFLALAMAAVTLAAPMAGCFPTPGPGGSSSSSQVSVEDGKIPIWAYAVDNGLTSQWIKDLAVQYNELPENANSKYQVIGTSGMMDATTTLAGRIRDNSTDVSIYFGCQANLKDMIVNDYLIDLSDMYEMEVDGVGNGTIAEKTHNYADLQLAWADENGNGIYGVSYGTGVSGMVFDYDWFCENGLMKVAPTTEIGAVNANGLVAAVAGDHMECTVAFGNYEVGDTILTAGKDGKYGTYDDGQATTYAEFNTLLADIMALNAYPFIFCSNTSRMAYTPTVEQATFMQELGYENVRTLMTYQGKLKDKNGTEVMDVNYQNAAEMFSKDIVKNAYLRGAKTYYDYLCGQIGTIDGEEISPDKMIHPSSYSGSQEHVEAQGNFVSAIGSYGAIAPSAFLIEGIWWEQSEARGKIDAQKNYTGNENHAFGKREFRYYLYPDTDTQISTKSVMALQDDGAGFLTRYIPAEVKQQGPAAEAEFLQECKKFLAFTLKESSLQYYTKQTGISRPFDYELTESDIAAMTPFQRATHEMCSDTEHVQMYRTGILGQMSLIRSYGKHKGTATINSVPYTSVWDAFGYTSKSYSLQDYVNASMAGYVEDYTRAYNAVANYLN